MLREIRHYLSGVRSRQRCLRGADGLMCGTAVGSALGLIIQAARLLDASIDPMVPWFAMLIGTVGGGLLGLASPISWHSAARLVDRHYGLKDRASTALEFATRSSDDPLVRLQVAEAIERLQRIEPRRVLPIRVPVGTSAAVVLSACLIGLVLAPRTTEAPVVVDLAVQQVVREQAANLEETVVEELRELARENPEADLQELAKEIEQLVEELKAPEVDQRNALSKLSEMQQQLAAALEQFDTAKTDAELKELAAALERAESMQALAEALKEGKYDKAAEKLEKIDASSMTRKEREAVAANLKQFRKKLGEGKEGELSEAAQEMADGLEQEDESQCKAGACKAAGVCKKQGLKKSISQCLNCQLNRLSECKGQCQNPGLCNSEGPAKKSDNPSNKAGKAASNRPLGEEATKIDAQHQRENLTGLQGDGPSERETSQSPEGEQDATRSYAARYSEFHKQMEQVLESEPLPLGHRETVRKYFESIRPSSTDLVEETAK